MKQAAFIITTRERNMTEKAIVYSSWFDRKSGLSRDGVSVCEGGLKRYWYLPARYTKFRFGVSRFGNEKGIQLRKLSFIDGTRWTYLRFPSGEFGSTESWAPGYVHTFVVRMIESMGLSTTASSVILFLETE